MVPPMVALHFRKVAINCQKTGYFCQHLENEMTTENPLAYYRESYVNNKMKCCGRGESVYTTVYKLIPVGMHVLFSVSCAVKQFFG